MMKPRNFKNFNNFNNLQSKDKNWNICLFDKITENQILDSIQQMSNMQSNENLMTQYLNPMTLQYNLKYSNKVQVKQQSTKTEHYQYLAHFITRKKILIDKERKIPFFEQVNEKHIVKNYPNYLFNLVAARDYLKPELNQILKKKDYNWGLFCDFNQPIKISILKNKQLNYDNLYKCNQETWPEQLQVVEAINTQLANQQNIFGPTQNNRREKCKKLKGQNKTLQAKCKKLQSELRSNLNTFNQLCKTAGLKNQIQRNETFDDFNLKITEIEKKCKEHQTPEKMDSQLLQHINALKEYVNIVKHLKDNKLMKKIIDINKSDIQEIIESNKQVFDIISKIVDDIKCDSENEETKKKYNCFLDKVTKMFNQNSNKQSKQNKKEMKQNQKIKDNQEIEENQQYEQSADNFVVQCLGGYSEQCSHDVWMSGQELKSQNSVIIQK